MKQRLITFLLLIFVILISCKRPDRSNVYSKQSNHLDSVDCDSVPTQSTCIMKDSLPLQFKFIEQIPLKKLPYSERINLENYSPKDTLSQERVRLLQLYKLDKYYESDSVFELRYAIHFSDSFKSLVVTYNGENYVYTYLINYDKNFKMIDNRIISHDEVAESLFRIYSMIYQNRVVVTEENDDANIRTTTEYSITEKGKIIKKPSTNTS